MALARVKTWGSEILNASDLNAEFDNILNNATSLISPLIASLDVAGFDVTNLDELEFNDGAADPTTTARFRLSGSTLQWRIEDARTNTTTRPFAILATTTGTPAASIGVGMRFDAESGDETPSNFGALDFIATDVNAGSEDTVLDILTRVAGAALTATYRFAATGAFRYIITHAATATRTLTLPDATGTIVLSDSPAFTTQISTPSIVTASGALTITPAAGSGLNINLSGAGDLLVNTDDLIVDSSTGQVSVGATALTNRGLFQVAGTIRAGAGGVDYGRGALVGTTTTVTGGGGATTIRTATTSFGSLFVVNGVSGTKSFTDLLLYQGDNATINVISSLTANTPAARTYTQAGEILRLSLDGADVYSVYLTGIGSSEAN